MNKTQVSLAVCGALGAMGMSVAQAQNATVNVYGRLYAELSHYEHGNRGNATADKYQNTDYLNAPGSALGFRGQEKLGGGMSAWFQCETSMDWRGANNAGAPGAGTSNPRGICNRDSALGLKGAFGNFFVGQWGTPFKRVTNDETGANDTGAFGVARVLYGTSSTYIVSNVTGAGAQGAPNRNPQGVWRVRAANSIAYDSPSFAGFQVMGLVTTGNHNTGATSGVHKARIASVGAQYRNGPIVAGVAYEKHKNFYGVAVPGGSAASDEHAWVVAGSYTFPVGGGLRLGAQFSEQKADTNAATGANAKVKTWMVGINWKVAGPHNLRANYAKAGDMKGTPGAVMGAGATARPAVNVLGSTSAYMWQIRYAYSLSKRTEVGAGYSKLENSSNATYNLGNTASSVAPGTDAHAYSVFMDHRF